ncbi:MAG TPA: META domain-containing protein [Bacteroidales bacterium]|jgi:heat shock protein HslJ|nr:META domain-containing protein [Bacteroidales bacterium]HPS71459.1 META domain-containing protein [Bacteroidales bacterium]
MKNKTLLLFTVIFLGISMIGCSTLLKKNKSQNKPLIGTFWSLDKVNQNKFPEIGSTPYILFSESGNFNGVAGCNKYFGTFILNKKTISIENSGATKKMCANMEVERLYLGALKKEINYYKIFGDTLILFERNKEVLRFVAKENTLDKNE